MTGHIARGVGSIDVGPVLQQVVINFQRNRQGASHCLILSSYLMITNCAFLSFFLSEDNRISVLLVKRTTIHRHDHDHYMFCLGSISLFLSFSDFLEINYVSIYSTDFQDFFSPNGRYLIVDQRSDHLFQSLKRRYHGNQ